MNSESSVELFIFDLMDINVNTKCHSQRSLFNYFMYVFVDFNYLRHNNYFLDNFLKQVRNFNYLFLGCENWHDFLLDGWYSLNSSLDNISNILFGNESLRLNDSVFVDHDLYNFSVSSFDSHNFFFNSRNLNNSLVDNGNLNSSISDLFNNLTYFDDNWNFNWEFNQMRYLDNFLSESFNFVNFRNFIANNNKFFNYSWNFNDSVSCLNNWLRNFGLHLLENLADIWSYFFDLFNDFSYYRFLNCTENLLHSYLLNFHLNNSLNLLHNLNYLFYLSVHRNNFFNNTVNWYRYFNCNDSRPLDFNHFFNFHDFGHNSFNFDFPWNLDSNFYNFLGLFLYDFDNLVSLFNRNNLLDEFLNYSIDFIVNIFNDFHLNNSVLDDGNLNKPFYFSDPFYFHNPIHYFLNNLRHFHNLLDHSRYNHNPFNYFFNFNNFGHFYHLFNYSINANSHFLNSLDSSWYFNDFLNNDLHRVVLSDEMIN